MAMEVERLNQKGASKSVTTSKITMVEFDDYPIQYRNYQNCRHVRHRWQLMQIHPRFSTSFDKKHIESVGDTVGYLLDFVESYNGGGGSQEVEDLEGKIASAVLAVEDVIESHVVDQILAGETDGIGKERACDLQKAIDDMESTKKHCTWLKKLMRCVRKEPVKLHLPGVMRDQILAGETDGICKERDCDLQKVIDDMKSIKEYIIGRFEDRRLIISSTVPPAASSRPVTAEKATMVGFHDYLIHLLDKLTGQPSHQVVILPIIGMGGVGKTTLARNAFDNLLVKQHFDVCSWATISQSYSAREILLQLLPRKNQEALNELGEELHKILFDRRYLIVLDDMWSVEVWDDIKFFFPENNNGSRIVVTTRLLNVARHFNSYYQTVDLLDKDKSWNLFCQESFGEEGCPTELEEVGKQICENCKGLPLSIVVIGGVLRKTSKSREYWKGIARDTYSILNSEGDNQCLNILSLSYNHLPAHLKPCFLYMGNFAEDEVILVSRLIQLWVAEGFLRPKDAQSLEEVAEGYLKDLVDRNLILVKRWGCNENMKKCNIHDLIRELCLSVAEKEKFVCVTKLFGTPRTLNRERRIVIRESMSNEEASRALGSVSLGPSLIHQSRLLRVPRAVDKTLHKGFLEADLRCVNLRYLDHRFPTTHFPQPLHIPTQVSLLWNLQTVRIGGHYGNYIAPSEIWEMVQLRHIHVNELYVPDPPRNDRVDLVLPNLQTLGNAMNFRLSEEVCKRIPNVKRMRLVYESPRLEYSELPLGQFHKLESLTLRFKTVNSGRRMMLNITFPTSLTKLTLYGSGPYGEELEKIGSLPNLEVLKLRYDSIIGSEWNPVEGGFRRLKVLQIESCRLNKWNADQSHFPVLEKLFLVFMHFLEEIPSGIGDIPMLQLICMYDSSVACALSAVRILEEQESLGNEDLKVKIGFYIWNRRKDRFRETMKEEGFTSNNLQITSTDLVVTDGFFSENPRN